MGNVTSKDTQVSGGKAAEQGTWSYGYDDADRMITATEPGGTTTTYGYDGAGNRTSVKAGAAPAVTTAYDDAGHPTSASDGTTYTTDATGALVEITTASSTRRFSHDTWGRTVQSAVPEGVVTSTSDALGRTITRSAFGQPTASVSSVGAKLLGFPDVIVDSLSGSADPRSFEQGYFGAHFLYDYFAHEWGS